MDPFISILSQYTHPYYIPIYLPNHNGVSLRRFAASPGLAGPNPFPSIVDFGVSTTHKVQLQHLGALGDGTKPIRCRI